MKKTLLSGFFFLSVFLIPLVCVYCINPTGGHRGEILSLIDNEDTVISAGKDGYIVIWNKNEKAAEERFQLTPYNIAAMAKHPARAEICIVEVANIDNYRLSVWNYIFKDRLFSIHSSEPITYINYSAEGSLIIACGLNGEPLSLIDSGSGLIINTPSIPPGNASLAITGRNERSMLVYRPDAEGEGQILYLDIFEDSVTASFQTEANLTNPLIFGNRRYIAAAASGGLLIIDAATGSLLQNYANIEKNALLYPAGGGFYCLSRKGTQCVLYRFSMNARPQLIQEFSFSLESTRQISAFAYSKNTLFLASGEELLYAAAGNRITAMAHNYQTRILDIASSPSNIAILTENDDLFIIPQDYNSFNTIETIRSVKKKNYSRLSPLSGTNQFILWQNANTRYTLQLINQDMSIDETGLKSLPSHYPLSAISSVQNKILTLKSTGNLNVYNSHDLSSKPEYTYSAIGITDAVFINEESLILSRVVISDGPFLYVNIKTGETVPFLTLMNQERDLQIEQMIYIAGSGNIYTAVYEMIKNEKNLNVFKTVFLKLTPPSAAAGTSVKRIFEYPGEEYILSLAESGGKLAIACGSEGAAIYSTENAADNTIYFERTEGLPRKLLGCEKFFLCIDSEGNLSWHDNKTGKILAVFKFYEDSWMLITGEKEISGSFVR